MVLIKSCTIKNCDGKPTRCKNYTYYCRIHFIRYVISHTIIYKKLINKERITFKFNKKN